MAKKRSRQATQIRQLEEKIRSLQAGAAAAPAAGVAAGARAQAGNLLTRAGAAVGGAAAGTPGIGGGLEGLAKFRTITFDRIMEDVRRNASGALDPAGQRRMIASIRQAVVEAEPGVTEAAGSRVGNRAAKEISKILTDAQKRGAPVRGMRAILAGAIGVATGKTKIPKNLPTFLKKTASSLKGPTGTRALIAGLGRGGTLARLGVGALGLAAGGKLLEGFAQRGQIQEQLGQARAVAATSPAELLRELATQEALNKRALRLQAQDPGAFQRLASAGGSSNAVSLPRGAVAFSPSGGGGAAASEEEIVQQMLEQLGS